MLFDTNWPVLYILVIDDPGWPVLNKGLVLLDADRSVLDVLMVNHLSWSMLNE